MRTVPSSLLTHLQGSQLSTAICWLIEKRDGTFIRGTEHDSPIAVNGSGSLAGIYAAGANIIASTVQAGSDMAPDNLDVQGAIPKVPVDYIDVSVADIEGGLLSQAPVTVFLVNWQAPDDGQLILRRGFLGEIERDSDGAYKTEVRGLLQLLSQIFIETFGERCVVKRFGDGRCKLPLAPLTYTGEVVEVFTRRSFDTDLSMSPFPSFRGGEFTFTSGDNAGYMREVKTLTPEGAVDFWEPFPYTPNTGDAFSVVQGCDRSREACKGYANLNNFRGHGLFIPGVDALTKGPT